MIPGITGRDLPWRGGLLVGEGWKRYLRMEGEERGACAVTFESQHKKSWCAVAESKQEVGYFAWSLRPPLFHSPADSASDCDENKHPNQR